MFQTREIDISFFTKTAIKVFVRRLDLLHPLTGGNKQFKLKYNLIKAKESGCNKVVSFGGAYSNHIAALAFAGKEQGVETIGIIRGEKETSVNPTLQQAVRNGMKLIFVNRTDYRNYTQSGLAVFENDPAVYMLPEGGSNYEGVKGCVEIFDKTDKQYSDLAIACGTGTTVAGIIIASNNEQRISGFSVLKDRGFIENNVKNWLKKFNHESKNNWNIIHDFHFGGYAKKNSDLEIFVERFNQRTGITIEPVYTGKLFYGLIRKIEEGYFKPGSKILAIHTGGLQYLNSELENLADQERKSSSPSLING